MRKNIVALLLCLLMLFSCAIPGVFAEGEDFEAWEETPVDVAGFADEAFDVAGGEDDFTADVPADEFVPEEVVVDAEAPEAAEPAPETDLDEEVLFSGSEDDPFAFGDNALAEEEDPEAAEDEEESGDFEYGYASFLDFAAEDAGNAYYFNNKNGSADTNTYYAIPADGKWWNHVSLVLRNDSGSVVSAKPTSGTIITQSGDSSYYSGKYQNGVHYLKATKAGDFWVRITNGTYTTYYHVIANFTDVALSEYYAVPVYWALSHSITSGASKTKFGSYNNCTRAQFVTFLWKYAGSPSPSSSYNPFRDVYPTDYYYNAVLWAYYRGITSGTSSNTFSPGSPCKREHCITFLWKAAGSPSASAYNKFWDVDPNEYYAQAITWAVNNGITSGVSSTTFGVGQTCKRAQIMTFLWKFAGSPKIFNGITYSGF